MAKANIMRLMKPLRNALLFLLIVIWFFLNLERLDIGQATDAINLQSFVYALGGVIVITHLLLAPYWVPSLSLSVAFWLAVYAVLKGVVFAQRPIFGGLYTYLSVTEMTWVGLLAAASWRLMQHFHLIRHTLATLSLEGISDRVKPLDKAEREIAREFARSRRHGVPLSVVVLRVALPPHASKLAPELQVLLYREFLERFAVQRALVTLDQEIRRTDWVLDVPQKKEILLLLPDTPLQGAEGVARRVTQRLHEALGLQVTAGWASFPEEAVTFEALWQQAEKRAQTLTREPPSPFDQVGSDGASEDPLSHLARRD